MKLIICIDKEDILFSPIGNNYQITLTNGTIISFTKEALEELTQDYQGIIRIK